jgi:hypothetical protein
MPKHIDRVINPRNFRKKVKPTGTRVVPKLKDGALPEEKPVKRVRKTRKSKDEERLNETNPVYSGQY